MTLVKPNTKELRWIIDSKGLDLSDVSRRTRGAISKATLSRLLTGNIKRTQLSKWEALAKALYVPLDRITRE